MNHDDAIPTVGAYRGVPLHAMQSSERIEKVVRPEIDEVYALPDVAAMAAYAMDRTKAPEARLFAEARAKAAWSLAAEAREIRPNVDLVKVRAATAGLNSATWMDPQHIGTLLEPSDGRPRREPDIIANLSG